MLSYLMLSPASLLLAPQFHVRTTKPRCDWPTSVFLLPSGQEPARSLRLGPSSVSSAFARSRRGGSSLVGNLLSFRHTNPPPSSRTATWVSASLSISPPFSLCAKHSFVMVQGGGGPPKKPTLSPCSSLGGSWHSDEPICSPPVPPSVTIAPSLVGPGGLPEQCKTVAAFSFWACGAFSSA